MRLRLAHPFSITVRPNRLAPGTFSWRINEAGGGSQPCALTFPTFEEARVAAKARLEIVVAKWCATQATAALCAASKA